MERLEIIKEALKADNNMIARLSNADIEWLINVAEAAHMYVMRHRYNPDEWDLVEAIEGLYKAFGVR